ncbi:hypothetical protein DPMN_168453 [Dreissena polymorpha]|uniref:Uncharacterized protein n=1 Tax=Dreissena polymorpha TaxID=45954 RepID=A0A9D4F557_DREPO|nr:hypothetical protein DPMN_168453 [Dreissena polymorpha]
MSEDLSDNATIHFRETIVAPPQWVDNKCCAPCSCDISSCLTLGTCCLDNIEYMLYPKNTKTLVHATCVSPQLKPYTGKQEYPEQMPNVLIVQKCPPDGNSKLFTAMTADKCDNGFTYADIETTMPVTDSTTNITYQNLYCALCHGVDESKMVRWTVKIVCKNEALMPSSLNNIVREVLRSEKCNLMFDIPSNQNILRPTCRETIGACNETGLWDVYDPLLEYACLAFYTPYASLFKNVFCYMCNTNHTKAFDYCPSVQLPFFVATFSVLLKLPDTNQGSLHPPGIMAVPTVSNCTVNQMHDPFLVSNICFQCKKSLFFGINYIHETLLALVYTYSLVHVFITLQKCCHC